MNTRHDSSPIHRLLVLLAWAAAASLLFLGLLTSVAAAAVVTQTPQNLNPLQEWTDVAKAPTPTSPIQVQWGDCPYVLLAIGCSTYDAVGPVGHITMDPSLRTDAAKRVYFHELGHVFSSRQMYSADEAEATRILSFPDGTSWRTEEGVPSPSEWFAEAATRCYMGENPIIPAERFTFDVNSPEVQGICDLMDRAALQIPRERFTFKVVVPRQRQMTSAGTFESGSIKATIQMGGKSVRSKSECFNFLRSGRNIIKIGTCTRTIRVWSRSKKRAVLTVTAVPSGDHPSTSFTYAALTGRGL